MNTTQAQSHQRRILGWHAIHWARVMDWLQVRRRGRAAWNNNPPDTTAQVAQAQSQEERSKQDETRKLHEAVKDTHRILAQARSVFPFMLFPDMITVDRQKLTIVYKQFFKSHQTVGVPLENVKNIQADLGPFFGSLTITSDQFINNTQTITHLARGDAKNIQQLVQGIVAAISEGIDLSKIEKTGELKDLLCKLGEGHIAALDN